uniref:Epidermal patterning factor-like protein n=1 Tax=Ananas comosus var. bracteatus TaxID=296719 RepID=A0A6V7NV63_ANACO|nr:unnamed protein product [Ananas comosus var. bracteatus]
MRRRRCSHRLSSPAVFTLFVVAVLGSSVLNWAVAHKYVPNSNPYPNPNQKYELRDRQAVVWRRRVLLGLGSAPPTCRSRCGACRPCRPVLVAVGPRRAVPLLEYYPEVWRCTCGNKLYVP